MDEESRDAQQVERMAWKRSRECTGIGNNVVMSLLRVQVDFMSGASSREIGSQGSVQLSHEGLEPQEGGLQVGPKRNRTREHRSIALCMLTK